MTFPSWRSGQTALCRCLARSRRQCGKATSPGRCADYLKKHPRAAVINLGCGLDDTGRACDNGMCRIYNIDLPDVIALRNRLLPAGGRERNLALDLRDPQWADAIDARPSDGAVLFAAGVFYYFTNRLRYGRMIAAMAGRFPGGRLASDAAGKVPP